MNRTLERRVSRLEQEAGSRPDELVECTMSDETKDLLRTAFAAMGMAPGEIEARVNQRYVAPCPHVASLSPVEREQRLLAIRERVAGSPAARALLDQALIDGRSVVRPISTESNAILDEARARLERVQGPAA